MTNNAGELPDLAAVSEPPTTAGSQLEPASGISGLRLAPQVARLPREVVALAAEAMARDDAYAALVLRLSTVPLLTRPMTERLYQGGAAFPTAADRVFTTAGTVLPRRRVVWSAREVAHNGALHTAILAEHVGRLSPCAVDLGIRGAGVTGPGLVTAGLSGFGIAAFGVSQLLEEIGCTALVVPSTLSAREKIRLIGELAPQVLYTRRSLLEGLVAMERGELRRLRRVVLVGEQCPRAWIDFIAHALGLAPRDILDGYGCVEVGIIAHRCRTCERYHYADSIVPEVIPAAEVDPCWAGFDLPGEGVLVVSSRIRRRMPIVRFLTYDLVRGHGSKPCDGTLRTGFDEIVGRLATAGAAFAEERECGALLRGWPPASSWLDGSR